MNTVYIAKSLQSKIKHKNKIEISPKQIKWKNNHFHKVFLLDFLRYFVIWIRVHSGTTVVMAVQVIQSLLQPYAQHP